MAGRDTSPTSITSAVSSGTGPLQTEPVSRASSAASPPMSTPPTSIGDEFSVQSDAPKMEPLGDAPNTRPDTPAASDAPATAQSTPDAPKSAGRRSLRASRASVTTYNVQILAGTAIHTPTKYLEKHHGNVLHGALEDALPKAASPTPPRRRKSVARLNSEDINDPAEAQLATEAAQAAQRRKSQRVDLRKEAIRNLTAGAGAVASKGAELFTSGKNSLQNALGAVAGAGSKAARGRGSANTEDEDADQEEEPKYIEPKIKKWEKQGLYVGQHREFDPRLKESQNRRKKQSKKSKENETLPQPMFRGENMLKDDYRRDFKLPFDVYNPLPRKVKVEGWVKLHKSKSRAHTP